MTLPVDLSLLQTGERFENMCFCLAQKKYPNAIAVSGTHDEGQDVLCFPEPGGDVVFQCKFTRYNIARLKPSIVKSLDSLRGDRQISKWILCTSANLTGNFINWLRRTVEDYPFIKSCEIWDRRVLLDRLEESPDIVHVFFYSVWKALETTFQTEELELILLGLAHGCQWNQRDHAILIFTQASGSGNGIVLDLTLRNRGSIQTLVHSFRAELYDVRSRLKGLPEEGVLLPQVAYSVSLRDGNAGQWTEDAEPPLRINPGSHQRFQIQLKDTGYAWTGYLRLAIRYGVNKEVALPEIFLRA